MSRTPLTDHELLVRHILTLHPRLVCEVPLDTYTNDELATTHTWDHDRRQATVHHELEVR